MSKPSKRVEIWVAPFEDGSGFAGRVVAAEHNDGMGPVFSVETCSDMPTKHWPELRSAIETALSVFASRPAEKESRNG